MESLATTTGLPTTVDTDSRMIALWLHGKADNTQEAYSRDIAGFLATTGKSLGAVTLEDLQRYTDALEGSVGTRRRHIAAVKSLLSFASKTGYIRYNVGAAITPPPGKDELAARILSEADTLGLIRMEPIERNRVMLSLLYATGIRVSELCALTWADVQPRDDAGQVTVYGKGGRTRAILLPLSVWSDVVGLHDDTDTANDAVFKSTRTGKALTRQQVHRIVSAAAERVGVDNVSAHWLRHAHASHALDRGCPIHLVQQTLGHSNLSTTGRYTHARPGDSSSLYLAC